MNKSEEAEAWLKTYDERIQAARTKVKAVIRPEETFSILEVSDKSYYGYGDNFGRGGQAVYRALELAPLEITRKELMGDTQWKEISREIVGDYAGDHIFLTVGENKMFRGFRLEVPSRSKTIRCMNCRRIGTGTLTRLQSRVRLKNWQI